MLFIALIYNLVFAYAYAYNLWQDHTHYDINEIIQYENRLYKCRISHTSVVNWYPSIYTLALWEPTEQTEPIEQTQSTQQRRVTKTITKTVTKPSVYKQVEQKTETEQQLSEQKPETEIQPQRSEIKKVEPQRSETTTTSIATYYFRIGEDIQGCPAVQSFDDGNFYGPCNGGQGARYTTQSKYWVAIRHAREHCGKTIVANYNGNQIELVVMDSCPGCEMDNHLDMSLEALVELTGSKEHACSIGRSLPIITWYFK
jgi:hypothetical protein